MNNDKTPRELELERIIEDLWWMARRYAHNRKTNAPICYNLIANAIINAGIDIKPITADGTVWAKDGMCGWPDRLINNHGRHNPDNAEKFELSDAEGFEL